MSREYLTPYRRYLNKSEQEVNASAFASYLLSQGWTLQAISAALGNWESECKLNPNYPQNSGYPTTQSGGFGLPQWTPWGSRYGAWLTENGIESLATDDNPAARVENQIAFHEYSCIYGQGPGKADWYSNHGYSYTWSAFKKSTDDPRELANAYYWQYERSGAGDPGTRPEQAATWFEFLTKNPPPPWKDFPIWLMLKIKGGVKRGKRTTILLPV